MMQMDELSTTLPGPMSASIPRFMYILSGSASLGGFVFGYDTGVVSSQMTQLRETFHLSSVWQEVIISITTMFAALAALGGGVVNEHFGRKRVIMGAAVVGFLGEIVLASANSVGVLCLGRCLIGVGFGFQSTTVSIYIAEAAPSIIRGRLVALNIAMTALGQFVGSILSSGAFQHSNGWRVSFGFGIIPPIAQFFVFFFYLPESPQWLIRKGQHENAVKALQQCRGASANVDAEFNSVLQVSSLHNEATTMQESYSKFREMMTAPSVKRALLLGCSLQMFQQLAGINTVMYYSNTILRLAGFSPNSKDSIISNMLALVNFVFTFFGLYLVEKIGRRPLTLLSLCGAVVSLAILAIGFQTAASTSPPVQVQEATTVGLSCSAYESCYECAMNNECGFCYEMLPQGVPINGSCLPTSITDISKSTLGRCNTTLENKSLKWSYDYCPNTRGVFSLIGLLLYMACFAPGMSPMPWTINSEIYPLWARSTANSLSTATFWFFTLLQSMTFLTFTEILTRHGTFWLYAVFSVIGLVLFYIILPETKGKTLEEIEGLFVKPWFSEGFSINNRSFQVVDQSAPYVPMNGDRLSFDYEEAYDPPITK